MEDLVAPAQLRGSVEASAEIARLIQSLANVTLINATQKATEIVGENSFVHSALL